MFTRSHRKINADNRKPSRIRLNERNTMIIPDCVHANQIWFSWHLNLYGIALHGG
jgi:ribosomal protein S19